MGETLRGAAGNRREWRSAAARGLTFLLALLVWPGAAAPAQQEAPFSVRGGRFTVLSYPQDERLARSLLAYAVATDTFPGLPRPRAPMTIAVAPDEARFREWIGPAAPEWGIAVAFPGRSLVVMQGRRAGSTAGEPTGVLRHELAHMVLYEMLGALPPAWFHEGYASYAAAEWGREDVLATSLSLVFRLPPSLASVDSALEGGTARARWAYALSYRAVAELAALDRERGLTLFFRYWQETGSLDRAMRTAYGLPLETFEDLWQRRTRRRYGALALVANFTLIGVIILPIILPVYVARRRRQRARLEAMRRADEAADRAARESALQELLRPPQDGEEHRAGGADN